MDRRRHRGRWPTRCGESRVVSRRWSYRRGGASNTKETDAQKALHIWFRGLGFLVTSIVRGRVLFENHSSRTDEQESRRRQRVRRRTLVDSPQRLLPGLSGVHRGGCDGGAPIHRLATATALRECTPVAESCADDDRQRYFSCRTFRSFSSAFCCKRETCICETLRRLAISVCETLS